jgi:hypothetical protein
LDGFLDRSSRRVSGAGRRTEAGCVEGGVWCHAAPPPKDTAVFLHGDLLPVNMLWSRGRITGLTDWNSIHRGARAIDVGHCRRYLAALYSPEWSQQLRSLYESIAGVTLDPWWDLYALLHYDDSGPKWIGSQVAGRRPVDVPGMTSRVEVAIETALRRRGKLRVPRWSPFRFWHAAQTLHEGRSHSHQSRLITRHRTVRDRPVGRSRQLPGVPLTRKPGVPPKGYESGDASSSSLLTTRTCPLSLWRNNDIRRTS